MFRIKSAVAALALASCLGLFGATLTQAQAQDATPKRGPVTNLPLPRFVSLKAPSANVRRGPSLGHKIDWIFKRRNMPLQITAEYSNWRRVVDKDGAGGWIHYSLLSGARTVVVEQDLLPLRARPGPDSKINAYIEAGVVARLGLCKDDWCEISSDGYKGWALSSALWGATKDHVDR